MVAAVGVIELSESLWAAPAVLIAEKDGIWGHCVDYRQLNAVTRKESYRLRCINDALNFIAVLMRFSILDLRTGYWQVNLALEAHPKTALSIT